MAIRLADLLAREARGSRYAYTERDTMLYALAIGAGRDPLDDSDLRFVFEGRQGLACIPSLAITVARNRLLIDAGMHVEKFLHAEQRLTLHRPLPSAGELVADHKVGHVLDKGADRGILVETFSSVRTLDGAPLFDVFNLYYCRGDGGVGSSVGALPRAPHPIPARAPDSAATFKTEPWLPLLYRLTGDRNLIHVDPRVAREAGFPVPILHGSCTLGIACRAIVSAACDNDPARMTSLGTRFSAPAYPGETIETQMWIDGDEVSFRCRAVERDVIVLDHGHSHVRLQNKNH